jgi:hypothetical protein
MLNTNFEGFVMPSFDGVGMKLESDKQRREREWLQQRLGKFTASNAYKLVTHANKSELPAGAITYILEKVVEVATDYEPEQGFITPEMQWGKDYELEAIEWFSDKFNYSVDAIGDNQQFLELPQLRAGATPDGLIDDNVLIEVKCPKSHTHLSYLAVQNEQDLKETEIKYYWQIMMSFLVSGREKAYFISYDPRFKQDDLKLHTAIIYPNQDDMAFLRQRLEMAHEYFHAVCTHRGIAC